MNPILISIGNIQIRWYSTLILIAFVVGYFLIRNRCKKEQIDLTTISDMCFYLIIVAILGARVYYCIFNLDYYLMNPISILKIWEGGLAIHGGVLAGIIFCYFYTKKKKLDLLKILDIIAPALVLGQTIGRWGNFFNSEAYGPVTSLNVLKGLHIPKFIIDGMYIDGFYHHPTFFYESLGCLIIFIILLVFRNKMKKGQVAGTYFIIYGLIRFLIESLRQDSLMLGNFKIAQIVSIIAVLVGIYLFIRPYLRSNYDKQKVGHSTKGRTKKRIL